MQALHTLYQSVLNETKSKWQKTVLKCDSNISQLKPLDASIYSDTLFPLHVMSDKPALTHKVLTRPSKVGSLPDKRRTPVISCFIF